MNYVNIIKYLYPNANTDPTGGNVLVETRPKLGLREVTRPKVENNRPVMDEQGQPVMETVDIEGPTSEFETVMTKWDIDAPKPTIAELEAYAQSQEYQDYLISEQAGELEEQDSLTRAQQLLLKIKTEREWLANNWDSAPHPMVKRLMKQNEEILQALFFMIRRQS